MNREYKIVKADKNDKLLTEIEVSGITSVVTPKEIISNIKYLQKNQKEVEAESKVEDATMENVKHNYPEINNLIPQEGDSEETKEEKEKFLIAINLFVTSRDKLVRYSNLHENIVATIKEEKENLRKIEKVTKQKYDIKE